MFYNLLDYLQGVNDINDIDPKFYATKEYLAMPIYEGIPLGSLTASSNFAYIDYKNKQIGLTKFFAPTGDEEADLNLIREVYKEREGFHPEFSSPIVFWKPPVK